MVDDDDAPDDDETEDDETDDDETEDGETEDEETEDGETEDEEEAVDEDDEAIDQDEVDETEDGEEPADEDEAVAEDDATDEDEVADEDDEADDEDEADAEDDDDTEDEDTEDEDTEDEDTEEALGAELDEEVFGSRDDFPDADDDDWEEDRGDWTDDDYDASARSLFGRGEHFGETADDVRRSEGWEPVEQGEAYRGGFEQAVPGAGRTVRFYQRGDTVAPLGFVTATALAVLRALYPQMDFGNLHVSVPPKARVTEVGDEARALPAELLAVAPAERVDLRRYATPVGDQGQTSRCSAFAWTHAIELLGNLAGSATPRLSCSYTMLQFQKKQGDFRDHAFAYEGGDGTEPGVGPGQALIEHGTCRHDHWPDDRPRPLASDGEMAADAASHRLHARVYEAPIDEVRKLLTAGCPVHVSMNTGDAFAELGRDGVFRAAEKPSGDHGRHAMLCVGYVGNYYIIKNSWGTEWGDQGYCYVPRPVLVAAEAEFVAIVPTRPRAGGGGPPRRCDYCGSEGTGTRCPNCLAPRTPDPRAEDAPAPARPMERAARPLDPEVERAAASLEPMGGGVCAGCSAPRTGPGPCPYCGRPG